MSYTADSGGVSDYLRDIADSEIDKGYIAESVGQDSTMRHPPTMQALRKCVPYSYFLEIQFCAAVYATVFAKVFPPLAREVHQLAYIEWLLYTEPDHEEYRDHLVHMFKVLFVGDQLLSVEPLLSRVAEWQFRSKHFKSWCEEGEIAVDSDRWDESEQKKIVRMAFFLAAIFHDFGYGYHYLRKYKQKLFRLYHWLSPGADHVDIDVIGTQALLKSLPALFIRKHHSWLNPNPQPRESDVDSSVVAGCFRDCLPLNHSIASTFFVLDVAESLKKSRALSPELYIAFQLAAEACMIHDMTAPKNWAHLEEKPESGHFLDCDSHQDVPLAMLLILADELAIWNRPTLRSTLDGNRKVVNELDRSEVPSEIHVSFLAAAGGSKIVIRPDRANDKIESIFKEELRCLKGSLRVTAARLH